MKVSLVISDLSVRGGTHKQLLRLAQYLVDSGDKVEILTYEYVPQTCYREFESFRIKTCSGADGNVKGHRRGERLVRGYKLAKLVDPETEILNVHDLGCEWTMLAVTMLRRDLPIVWQINDLHPAFRVGPSKGVEPYWMHPIHRAIGRFLAHRARAVTVNVTKNAERVSHGLGIEPRVYYCGVDQLRTDHIQRTLRHPLMLVSIGVVFRYRNYESILDAMVLLRDIGLDTQLTIIGSTKYDPAYAAEIDLKARTAGLTVRVAGDVDQETMQSILETSHVFVFVNVDQSWGLAVFEAMTMSLPVVLSRSVGAVELLNASQGVQIVDPQDPAAISAAVQRIVADQDTYNSFSYHAFCDGSGFSWEKMYCSRMRDLFKSVIYDPAYTNEVQGLIER
jgi:glycosyltransferase involved in cell wall biosynthesis